MKLMTVKELMIKYTDSNLIINTNMESENHMNSNVVKLPPIDVKQ
jgi:hypothetical protein